MTEKRFEMVTVEDPLWEYGTHFKDVLQDNQTGKQYRDVSRLVDLLNELSIQGQLAEKDKQMRGKDAEKMFAHTFIVEKGLEKGYVKWVTQMKKEILKDNNLKNVLIQTDKIISNHLKTHTSGCKCCKCKYFEQELCYKGHIVPYPYFCNDYSGGV